MRFTKYIELQYVKHVSLKVVLIVPFTEGRRLYLVSAIHCSTLTVDDAVHLPSCSPVTRPLTLEHLTNDLSDVSRKIKLSFAFASPQKKTTHKETYTQRKEIKETAVFIYVNIQILRILGNCTYLREFRNEFD